jgi:1,4-dihydroxy-2-naphthoate octaprenyltransferase
MSGIERARPLAAGPHRAGPAELLRAWWRASRPRTLVASYTPVIVGSTFVGVHRFSIVRFLLTLGGCVAVQIATNLLNDYFDHVQGLDTGRAARANNAIQDGLLSPRAILLGGVAMLALAAGMGIALAILAGPLVLWLAVASALAAVFYTARPLKLGYRRLGEVTVFIFMGPVIVGGAAYVQQAGWSWQAAFGSLPIALLTTAILHANNMRDIEDDRRTGKRTLANTFGPRFALAELGTLVFSAYVALIALCAAGVYNLGALLALLTLPAAWTIVVRGREAFSLEHGGWLIGATARLDRNFGLLLAAGVVLVRLLH